MAGIKHDARVFTGIGIFLLIAAIIGFSPRYFVPIVTGEYQVPSQWMHAHAVASILWLLLFIIQPWLITRGNRDLHRRFGIAGIILAIVNIYLGVALQIDLIQVHSATGNVQDGTLSAGFRLFGSLLTFIIFLPAALIMRRKTDFHMRYMLLATLGPMESAFGRIYSYIFGIPIDIAGPLIPLTHLLLIIAMMIYDKRAHGRVHKAYWWGLGVFIGLQAVIIPLVFSDWWRQTTMGS